MSGVFQVVAALMPGVPAVPKPAGPSRHPLSSKPRWVHSAGGRVVVNRHGNDRSREAGTSSVTFGGIGAGAYSPSRNRSRPAHFDHSPGSSSILMNRPPITGRARMPSLFGLSVTYESTNGSRAVVSFR